MDLSNFRNGNRMTGEPLRHAQAGATGQQLPNPGHLHDTRSPGTGTAPNIHYYIHMVKHTLTKLAGLLVWAPRSAPRQKRVAAQPSAVSDAGAWRCVARGLPIHFWPAPGLCTHAHNQLESQVEANKSPLPLVPCLAPLYL